MIEAPLTTNEEEFMYAVVPLRSAYLCQVGLFDHVHYPLPKVIPGEVAVIVDSDEWGDNFKRGIVRRYNFLTGAHTLEIESSETLDCYGREIRHALRS
jgi:hypothetical protein